MRINKRLTIFSAFSCFILLMACSPSGNTPAPVLRLLPQTTQSFDDLISRLRIYDAAEHLTIEFLYLGLYKDFQVFLDADQNFQTGMKIEEYGGIDFLLENNILYSYNGSGSNWSWILVDTKVAVNDDGKTITWIIARSALEYADKINIRFKCVDVNSNDVLALPKLTFQFK